LEGEEREKEEREMKTKDQKLDSLG